MTCWGKLNVLLMSFRGWNTDWAITWGMRCSVMFIRVKTSNTEEGMMAFTSLRRVTTQTWEPELITTARVNACVGFGHVSEPSQKRLSKAFIQRSVMPHQRLSKRHLLFEFPEKKIKNTVFVRYTCTEPLHPYYIHKEWCIHGSSLHKSAARHDSDMGTGADHDCSSQCLCWVWARFWTIPEAALQGVYTAICHATSKTVKTPFIIWISWKKNKKYCIRSLHVYRTVTPLLYT